MNFQSDIDIDFGNRDLLLECIPHTSASIRTAAIVKKHPSGVYVSGIPYDPVNQMSAIDYDEAEKRGYFKLDLLNVHVYAMIRDEQHLLALMREPDWSRLRSREFVLNLIHLNNHYQVIQRMPEPISNISQLSMFLALIRPAKRHLIGLPWNEIAKTVWDKDADGYTFKKAHGCSYATLVVVHMNLLVEESAKSLDQSNTAPF
jgi:hypothetical protein